MNITQSDRPSFWRRLAATARVMAASLDFDGTDYVAERLTLLEKRVEALEQERVRAC